MQQESPSYRIHHDDCLRISSLEGSRLFDLIYLEPPDDMDVGATLLPRMEALLAHLDPQGFLLVHFGGVRHLEAKAQIDKLGPAFKGDLLWAFRQRAFKIKALQNHHETILVYSDNPLYFPKRELFAESVIGPSSSERTGLPGQKPVKLYARLLGFLEDYHAIESVLDPMMGSGSLPVAALERGKNVVGIDLSAQCCEIARRRLEEASPASRQLQFGFEDLA